MLTKDEGGAPLAMWLEKMLAMHLSSCSHGLKFMNVQVDALLEKHSVNFDGPEDTHEVPLILEAFVAHKV